MEWTYLKENCVDSQRQHFNAWKVLPPPFQRLVRCLKLRRFYCRGLVKVFFLLPVSQFRDENPDQHQGCPQLTRQRHALT